MGPSAACPVQALTPCRFRRRARSLSVRQGTTRASRGRLPIALWIAATPNKPWELAHPVLIAARSEQRRQLPAEALACSAHCDHFGSRLRRSTDIARRASQIFESVRTDVRVQVDGSDAVSAAFEQSCRAACQFDLDSSSARQGQCSSTQRWAPHERPSEERFPRAALSFGAEASVLSNNRRDAAEGSSAHAASAWV